jgi:hypothetical protein
VIFRDKWRAFFSYHRIPPVAGGDTNDPGTLALVAAADLKAGVFLKRK